MRKNKTFSKFSFIIIVLSLILGISSKVNAEKAIRATGEIRVEKQALAGERELQREENRNEIQNLKDESKKEVNGVKEEAKSMIQSIIDQAKKERTEFKVKIQTVKEETKTKTEEIKAKFKENLGVIKNETKKTATENIINSINSLNAKLTAQLLDKTSQIENVLLGIQSRITKGEEKGLDISSVKELSITAKAKIVAAREAIVAQQSKVYTATVTDEATLKAKIKEVRDGFKLDIKTVRGTVVSAHEAVKNVAVKLAQIQGIDDQEEPVTTTNATTTE